MFDIGFFELVVVGVVALLVVGPERLPRLARTAGLWLGRARRTLATVKAEIDNELKAEELKEILAKQARENPLETIIEMPQARTTTATSAAARATSTSSRRSATPRPMSQKGGRIHPARKPQTRRSCAVTRSATSPARRFGATSGPLMTCGERYRS